MNSDLFLAILSLDSYNRGYVPNIALSGVDIGNVKISKDSSVLRDANGVRLDQSSGFYALSYTVTDDTVSGLANGSTVIAYRGTDNLAPFQGGSDIWNGWVIGAGLPIAQAPLTLELRWNYGDTCNNPLSIFTCLTIHFLLSKHYEMAVFQGLGTV